MSSPPRLEAYYFRPSRPDPLQTWPRLVSVLERSAAAWCPGWQIRVAEHQAPTAGPGMPSGGALANTAKLWIWSELVDAAADGDRLILLDADTMLTGSLEAIWDAEFDVAYTVRPKCVPLNAGVIAIRVGERARRFMRLWRQENARIVQDHAYGHSWRRRYAGWNQAALGKVLEEAADDHGARVLAVPCVEWNCEDTAWGESDPARTRIVHVKSQLRCAVLGTGPVPAGAQWIVARWQQIDRERSIQKAALV